MPRQRRYAKRYMDMAREAILAGKSAHKALALALEIRPTELTAWLERQPDFASAVADARAELARRKAEARPAGVGRKSKYDPDMDAAARLHAAAGNDDAAIARELGISVTSLRNWREAHPSLHEAIQEGRDHWNVARVEDSLIMRAKGYRYTETTTEVSDRGTRTVTMEKEMPPDARAAQFVLTNRAPERWKSKQEVAHTLEVGLTMPDAVRELFNSIMHGADAAGADDAGDGQ